MDTVRDAIRAIICDDGWRKYCASGRCLHHSCDVDEIYFVCHAPESVIPDQQRCFNQSLHDCPLCLKNVALPCQT
jgi:hypothetical protein